MAVERPILEMDELNETYKYEKLKISCKEQCKDLKGKLNLKPNIKKILPVIDWLPKYGCKEQFPGDLVGGLTLSVLQLPQAMACAILAEVPAVNGIYTAIFPMIIYFIFGTSKHISVGTFAMTALMTGSLVSDFKVYQEEITGNTTAVKYNNVEILQAITFTVALIEIAMYILNLGIISQLLSDTFLNGFICATSYHIANSQIRDLIGLPTTKRSGNFAIPLTIHDVVMNVEKANIVAVIISFFACSALLANNYLFKPWLSKRTKIPFPAELFVVAIVIIFTRTMDLDKNYNVTIIGAIPTGFPDIALPKLQLIPTLFVDSLIITIVCCAITISLALIFARKCLYEVDTNQELLAMGLANAFGSLNLCIPISASLSRSMLRYTAGGSTQLAAIVSISVLMLVLLWIAPLFEYLPRCILASIIIVALMDFILKVRLVYKYWRLSRWDCLVWIVTFLMTFLIHVNYGLIVGITTSIIVICIQGQKPHCCLLGVARNTDLYLDVKEYSEVQEIDGIKIFQYSGGLNYILIQYYKMQINKKIGFDPRKVLYDRAKNAFDRESYQNSLTIRVIILDFSSITSIDLAGVDFLSILWDDYRRIDIEMIIAGCIVPIFQMIKRCHRIQKKEKTFLMFASVHDAVLFSQVNFLSKNK